MAARSAPARSTSGRPEPGAMLTRRACVAILAASATVARAQDSPRLVAPPHLAPPLPPAPLPGEFRPLGLGGRDAILYAPKNFSPAVALPLLMMLHGSG